MSISQPLRALCFLARYRLNRPPLLFSESGAATAAVPAACGPDSASIKWLSDFPITALHGNLLIVTFPWPP